jgi:acylphosphatase
MDAGSGQVHDGPLHVQIHGRVQGVGFRESMIYEAMRLDARGWVRNRIDGTVEAVFDGSADTRAKLLAWTRHGPDGAHVSRVDVRPANDVEMATIGAHFTRLPTAR